MIYYIGIDISKYKHDFCIISNTGEVIVENSSFENNKKGFQYFLDQLKPYNKSECQIAFEATGHYSLNLELDVQHNMVLKSNIVDSVKILIIVTSTVVPN